MKELVPPFVMGFDKNDLAVHSFYVPKDPFSVFKLMKYAQNMSNLGENIKFSSMTLEFLLRFQTNQLIVQSSKFTPNPMHTEFHFVRFEGQYKEIDISLQELKNKGWIEFK